MTWPIRYSTSWASTRSGSSDSEMPIESATSRTLSGFQSSFGPSLAAIFHRGACQVWWAAQRLEGVVAAVLVIGTNWRSSACVRTTRQTVCQERQPESWWGSKPHGPDGSAHSPPPARSKVAPPSRSQFQPPRKNLELSIKSSARPQCISLPLTMLSSGISVLFYQPAVFVFCNNGIFHGRDDARLPSVSRAATSRLTLER